MSVSNLSKDAVCFTESVQLTLARLRDVATNVSMLQLHCVLHQACLIRKPLVLSLENYWSTVVRLAHLFESPCLLKGPVLFVLHLLFFVFHTHQVVGLLDFK